MKNNFFKKYILLALGLPMLAISLMASSHREAPLIADDPTADNVDLYAFRSPDNPDMVTLIATYIPMQLPHGGPNYYNFDPSVRYEIHVDNDVNTPGDDVTYRFTFTQVNEDPTTFFNIRLGKQNLKTTYKLEKITATGTTVIVANGIVPPNNIGTRSITGGAGLNTTYNALFKGAITTASTGERVYAGPSDDPFFVDLGGIFDLGDAPRQNGRPSDGLACMNVHALAIQVPIANLLKAGAPSTPRNILDSDYVIGVWASASRPKTTVFSATNDPVHVGEYVQVSRLGMPLTNEAVIPIGQKDLWNATTPYDAGESSFYQYFYNPELALYMDDDQFGGAVPAFGPLRIQKKSLGAFDFTNGADGLFGLKGTDAVKGTAFELFPDLLLPAAGQPRSVDLWPIFHTGAPNAIPYQLATGKGGNPLAAGKPFINNFLPNGGDMLRLNMAVPVTPRSDPNFSSLGLVQAAAIGLTVSPYNTRADLEFIPNMDGFPNGRRLEDDVTRIELQAVSGVVLAAVGLWYDDYDPATSPSPVTEDLLGVLSYTTGVEKNDKPFTNNFPYLAQPHSGTGECSGTVVESEPVEPVDPPVVEEEECAPPTGITVELISPKRTRVRWNKSDGASRYQFQIRFKGMNKWLVTARIRGNTVAIFAPANRTYEFRIAAVCGNKAGEYGAIMEYTSMSGLTNPTTAESRSSDNTNEESIFIDGEELNVFPNPVISDLTVQYKTKGTGTISLFHVSGAEVRTIPLRAGNSSYNLNMSDLASGLYVLKIMEDGQLPITQRVVKQAIK